MKIAIINKVQYYINDGGMALYDRNIIDLITSMGHKVDHFHTKDMKSIDNLCMKKGVISKKIEHPSRFIEELIEQNEYDLIINNNPIVTNKIVSSDKVIVIQHADYNEYWENCLIGYKIASLFSKNKLFGNPLFKAKNVVYYSKYHAREKQEQNQYFIPLYSELKFNNKMRNPKNIFYASRLDFAQKGVDRLPKIMNQIEEYKNLLVIGGSGAKENFIRDHFKESYIGNLTKEQMYKELNNARVSVITSRWEGFSYFAVESLSLGVPVIAYDTFDSLNLFKESGGCFVVKENDHESFAKYIKQIMEMPEKDYKIMSENIVKWSKENLSKQLFIDGWKRILSDFENKK